MFSLLLWKEKFSQVYSFIIKISEVTVDFAGVLCIIVVGEIRKRLHSLNMGIPTVFRKSSYLDFPYRMCGVRDVTVCMRYLLASADLQLSQCKADCCGVNSNAKNGRDTLLRKERG